MTMRTTGVSEISIHYKVLLIHVCLFVDINAVEQLYLFDEGNKPEPNWLVQYCVLRLDEQMIRHHPTQEEVSS